MQSASEWRSQESKEGGGRMKEEGEPSLSSSFILPPSSFDSALPPSSLDSSSFPKAFTPCGTAHGLPSQPGGRGSAETMVRLGYVAAKAERTAAVSSSLWSS